MDKTTCVIVLPILPPHSHPRFCYPLLCHNFNAMVAQSHVEPGISTLRWNQPSECFSSCTWAPPPHPKLSLTVPACLPPPLLSPLTVSACLPPPPLLSPLTVSACLAPPPPSSIPSHSFSLPRPPPLLSPLTVSAWPPPLLSPLTVPACLLPHPFYPLSQSPPLTHDP